MFLSFAEEETRYALEIFDYSFAHLFSMILALIHSYSLFLIC